MRDFVETFIDETVLQKQCCESLANVTVCICIHPVCARVRNNPKPAAQLCKVAALLRRRPHTQAADGAAEDGAKHAASGSEQRDISGTDDGRIALEELRERIPGFHPRQGIY